MSALHLDLRAEGPPPDVVRDRYHRGRLVLRDPATVDGIVIHQTACTFGPADDAMKRHRRALRIPAHATAFRSGVYVTPVDLRAYANHANALNARSLGLEIEGLYPGLEDDPATVPDEAKRTTWGGDPDDVTPLVIDTARAALTALVTEARTIGMPIRYVWAHRQSSPTRRSDPGEGLWREVALWGVANLGLVAQPAERFGLLLKRGKPIPRAWDPAAGVGDY